MAEHEHDKRRAAEEERAPVDARAGQAEPAYDERPTEVQNGEPGYDERPTEVQNGEPAEAERPAEAEPPETRVHQ